jgi:uncharacterized protein (TIGR03437 family)
LRPLLIFGILAVSAHAQVAGLTNASVSGPFFFRQLQITTDDSSNITDSRAALGTITFDGAGHYTLNAQQTITTYAATPLTGQGTYAIGPSGTMQIGNPQRNSLMINARVGTEAIVGSTTESGDNTFDLFIAVPAASPAQAASLFAGTYYTATLEFPLASSSYVRSAFFELSPLSNGLFSLINGVGHALNVSGGQITSVSLTGATYSLNGDGTAAANFGSASNNLGGLKDLLISATGDIILGGSVVAGSLDFLVGVRAYGAGGALSNFSGLYYTGGLRYDAKNPTTAGYVGSSNALPSLSLATSYQRLHQLAVNPAAIDYTGYESVSLNTDGTYTTATFNALGLGPSGTSFVDADLATQSDNKGFSIDFGVAVDAFSGSGVYINPQGILNGASFSPVGESIAPGEFISIFGSGLAPVEAVATPPYPASLNGVTVTVNSIEAPIYLVSPNQLNVLVPYSVTGTTATLVAINNGKSSNSVAIPLSTTAPGVFTQNSSGTGLGAILHANNTLVTSSSPAKKGETVSIYLTGLGAVSPSVSDGTAGLSSPLSKVTETVKVTIGNASATVLYAGLAPGLPGLYQINVTVPTSLTGSGNIGLAVQTPEAFAEQSTIAIQ